MSPPTLSSPPQDCSDNSEYLCFYMNFRVSFSIFSKKAAIILIEFALICRLGDFCNNHNTLYFFLYKNVSSENRDSFISSFHISLPFLSFSCVIAFSRISTIMLSRNVGADRHPCLVPDFRGKDFNLSLLSTVLALGFFSMPFSKMRRFPSIPNLESFYHESMLNFVNCVFYAIEIIL